MTFRAQIRDMLASVPLLDGLFRRFVWSRVHFPEPEMRALSSVEEGAIDIALDVGAAKGCYSWILNRKSQRVFAFEPGKNHRRFISRVSAFTNIVVVPAAVGASSGSVRLYTPGTDRHAMHSASISSKNPVVASSDVVVEEVDQVVLDEFCDPLMLQGRSIDFLKIDVEGYENEVLKGASAVLQKCFPLVVCEIEARHNADYREAFDFMESLGYSCFYLIAGRFERLRVHEIEHLQKDSELEYRLSEKFVPELNRYVNNFVFQHPRSRVKFAEGN